MKLIEEWAGAWEEVRAIERMALDFDFKLNSNEKEDEEESNNKFKEDKKEELE